MSIIQLNVKPDRKTLAQFGLVALVAFGLIGGLIFWRKEFFGLHLSDGAARTTALVLWGLGGLSALLGLVKPELNRFLFVGLILVTFPIGFVLSYVIMGIIFYLIITPVGLVFRLIGRDPLAKRFDPKAATYWVPHRNAESVERYFRQF
jgi:hypothetical protein